MGGDDHQLTDVITGFQFFFQPVPAALIEKPMAVNFAGAIIVALGIVQHNDFHVGFGRKAVTSKPFFVARGNQVESMAHWSGRCVKKLIHPLPFGQRAAIRISHNRGWRGESFHIASLYNSTCGS